MTPEFFASVGGKPELPVGAQKIGDVAPEDIMWNFGLQAETPAVTAMISATPALWDALPNLKGKWDGKSTINHWDAAQKVLSNPEELIQYQPRGTCGGRAGSLTGDLVQCILIASGKRAKFHRCSHAAIYFAARKKYGMLNGDWRDDNNDGVASGSVPEALGSVAGYVQREETGDTNWYGAGSDDLACQLGAGMHSDLQAKILQAGSDNIVTARYVVRSWQELADGIAGGGVGIGSDSQGFTMQRDSQGFCSPSGTWHHYHVRASIGVYDGRSGFGYAQSWGKTTPSGPALRGHPGNCFGVDVDVQDRVIKNGRWEVVFGFPLWDLQKGVDIPWIF